MNIQKYCLDMIESILCYDCKGYKTAKDVLDYENNAYHNYLPTTSKSLVRIGFWNSFRTELMPSTMWLLMSTQITKVALTTVSSGSGVTAPGDKELGSQWWPLFF